MTFRKGNRSYEYIKRQLHINKKGNIQAITFRKIKRASTTLDLTLLKF